MNTTDYDNLRGSYDADAVDLDFFTTTIEQDLFNIPKENRASAWWHRVSLRGTQLYDAVAIANNLKIVLHRRKSCM